MVHDYPLLTKDYEFIMEFWFQTDLGTTMYNYVTEVDATHWNARKWLSKLTNKSREALSLGKQATFWTCTNSRNATEKNIQEIIIHHHLAKLKTGHNSLGDSTNTS